MTVFSRVLTAVLLVVAAALAGLLVYRQVSPGVLGGDALDVPLALPALPLVSDRGPRRRWPPRTGGCGWCSTGSCAARTCAR
ncbi:hypothetical protein [Deinococcus aquaticus]|uniref:hypothetical protein n=1 Tax=Deinococcus aquaticus TaxID=328692 RepID=UPI003609629F